MICYYCLEKGSLVSCESEGSPVLLITTPNDGEQNILTEMYRIDEHTLRSALDPDELARLEKEPGHTAVIFKIPVRYDPEKMEFAVSSIGLFLFQDRLILVAPEDVGPFCGKPFTRLRSLPEVMLKILSHYLGHYLSHLQVIDRISDELADKISASMENKYLLQLFALEKSLVYYLNSLTSNAMLLEKLLKSSRMVGFNGEDEELLEDIIIENSQAFKQAEMYSNILSSMMDARVSIVNNNLNILMKRLNIITISLMAPTLVVSAFSMNVPIPIEKNDFAFWMILCLSLVSMAGVLLFWKFKK
ncbi:magnesium transporter [Syntrophus gentianae]|uniref:Magnesium transporter n=1 Tax=Syntrophus gentianae TaxID=43775 RepID=A0A1H7WVI5_9BACT|nr:magnesium transporter CorA family protein [Syntrophus gentianae]SEM25431.1 magnesium transporter [Syntrophus gentianae]